MEEYENIGGRGLALTTPVLVRPNSGLKLGHFKNGGDKASESSGRLFAEYARVFKRRRAMILLFTLIGGLAGWGLTVGVQPVYRARTSLDIQNLNADFLNMKAVSQTGNEGSSSEAYVQTQIKLLQSETLRERTVNAIKREGIASGLEREVRFNQAKTTSEWLSRQLADVKESVDQAQKKLEARTGNDALTLKEGGASVAEEKLRELQSELMKAQGQRVEKQAQYEISTSAPPDSLPMVLDSTQLRDDQIKLADLERQIAALVPPLTEANPKVQHLRAQIREIEDRLSKEKGNVLERMRNEYQAASHREALLNSAYRAQEARVSQEQGREAQVSMLRREVDSGEQLYQTLLQRVKEAGFASAMQASTIRVVDAAKAPVVPISPRRGTSAAVGLLLGMLAGISCAFFKERTQTVLRGPGEVSRYLNLRELGVIPSARRGLGGPGLKRAPRPDQAPSSLLAPATEPTVSTPRSKPHRALDMAVWHDHASLVAEAYRNTTYSVLLAGKEIERARTFVITSPSVGEGKTTVTCNLGLALAQANRRVLLIDGDLRKPRLHKAMDVSNGVGLRELLRGDIDAKLSPAEAFCRPTQVPGLFVITSGSGSEEPSRLLHSERFRTLLDRLTGEFDFVLIDSPPMLHMADARILAGMSNGVILVLRARVTDIETAAASRDLFLDDHVRVIGTILNDFDPSKEGRARYYNSYYQYADMSKASAEESKSA